MNRYIIYLPEVVYLHIGKESKKAVSYALPVYLLHCTIGIASTLLIAFCFSLLISTDHIPYTACDTIVFVSVLFGSFLTSLISSLKFGKPLITSLIQGISFLIVSYIIGGIIYSRFIPNTVPMSILVCAPLGSLLSAIFSAMFKHRKTK